MDIEILYACSDLSKRRDIDWMPNFTEDTTSFYPKILKKDNNGHINILDTKKFD